MRAFVLLALLASSAAWAGDKKPAPTPAPTSPTSAEQNQAQGQLQGQLQGQAQGQDQQQAAIAGAAAGSSSTATGVGHGGAGGTGIGGAGGNSGGNTFENSTSFDSRDRALALALPGQTAAPAVAGECLEHLRGGSGASIGVSGRTRINRECMEFQQCVALADRYAAWGQLQLAVEQLAKCGGVQGAVIAAPPSVVESTNTAFVTREEFERAYVELLRK